jgi:ribose transport system permease protein
MPTVLKTLGNLVVRYRLLVMLAAVVIFGGFTQDDFLTPTTFQSVLDRAAVVGFLALGLTPVLIAGQIDLSIGSVMSLAAYAAIALQPEVGSLPAACLGLGVGVLAGAINGVIIVGFKVTSLVATLATLLIGASLALLISDGQPVSSADPLFGLFLTDEFLAILSPRSALFVAAALMMFVWLKATPSGRNLYAVGSSMPAAVSAGINVNAYIAGIFVLSGFCAGAAGVIQALSSATGSPLAGSALLIPAITAVVIGGTRLEGGRGSSLATLGGVVALGALTTLSEYNGVPSYTQAVYTGLILILLITLDRIAGGNGGRTTRTLRSAAVKQA